MDCSDIIRDTFGRLASDMARDRQERLRILVACEFSGAVRNAFRALGHDAWSCDLLPAEDGSPYHEQCDVEELWGYPHWDMILGFPPCTNLCVSGARWFATKRASGEQQESIRFFLALANAPAPRICIENPVGIMSTHYRKPDQIIQPWQFGHGETKASCLWLKGLPKLVPTDIVEGRENRIHRMPPGPNRGRERSRTYTGIAKAMAEQWGNL